MRHARHDQALEAIEKPARGVAFKYIIIIYDSPGFAVREASFVSNTDIGDVAAVCDAVSKQIRQKRAN